MPEESAVIHNCNLPEENEYVVTPDWNCSSEEDGSVGTSEEQSQILPGEDESVGTSEEQDLFSTNVRYDRKSGDLPLYPGALITAQQSRCLVMEMANRHRLSGAATDDILKLISLHCPVPSHCCPSLYLLQKEFELPSSELKLCYYCPSCFVPLEEGGGCCPNQFCNQQSIDPGSDNFFIVLSIESQLKSIFSRKYLSSHSLLHVQVVQGFNYICVFACV